MLCKMLDVELLRPAGQRGSTVEMAEPAKFGATEPSAALALPTQGARTPPRAEFKSFEPEEASSEVGKANDAPQHEGTAKADKHETDDADENKMDERRDADENGDGRRGAAKRAGGAEVENKRQKARLRDPASAAVQTSGDTPRFVCSAEGLPQELHEVIGGLIATEPAAQKVYGT